jgi:argininosuccinate lyase
MPAFTHLQIAQPVSVGHYLLAYFEMFKRDLEFAKILLENFKKECPLGSGALAGTTYNIDRNQTAQELGFASPTRNSLDSVSDRDFATDFMYLASRIAVHMSRLAEEMILFASKPFDFVKFSDAFSTGSSIMPQKKNPDAAELLRGKAGRIFGNLQSLLVTMKGLPLAYSKDMQEDKEPLFDSSETIITCLRVLHGIIGDVQFNTKKMEEMAGEGYSNATDFADYLVQKLGIPFRDAHHITGKCVAIAISKSKKLEDIALEHLQSVEQKITDEVYKYINIQTVVARRNSFGGTGFDRVQKQISDAKEYIHNL